MSVLLQIGWGLKKGVDGVLLAAFLIIGFDALADQSRPNILVVLADDMGYGDLGATGSELLKTPHLDRLVQSGVFCRQAYVTSPVCSPSRAGLMTGRDPRRFGYEENLNKNPKAYDTRPELLGLVPGEKTLGDHLTHAGYDTALIGKWHLGLGAEFHPNRRGFGHFSGMLTGSHSYFPTQGKHQLERNGIAVAQFSSPYLTDYFTDEGIAWLEQERDSKKPWFLFMSYNAPHGPMQATDEDLARFSSIENPRRRTYAAMMFALDRGMGRLMKWLKDQEAEEETLIVFFSDNGGATSNASWNGPFSGAKGTLKEGGIRVPMIWHWPGVLPSGTEIDQPVSSLDLLPTFLAAAEAEPLPLREALSHEDRRNFRLSSERFGPYDGLNLLPILKGQERSVKRTLFWRLQGQTAIRWGDDKLIKLSHRPAQWFQPAKDLSELHDLATSNEPRMKELFEQLGAWEALLPTVPLWGSSPYWISQSALHYDSLLPKPEPR